eukprot:scaffold96198_cov69-Phaeocystis_antarctica.AAC.9
MVSLRGQGREQHGGAKAFPRSLPFWARGGTRGGRAFPPPGYFPANLPPSAKCKGPPLEVPLALRHLVFTPLGAHDERGRRTDAVGAGLVRSGPRRRRRQRGVVLRHPGAVRGDLHGHRGAGEPAGRDVLLLRHPLRSRERAAAVRTPRGSRVAGAGAGAGASARRALEPGADRRLRRRPRRRLCGRSLPHGLRAARARRGGDTHRAGARRRGRDHRRLHDHHLVDGLLLLPDRADRRLPHRRRHRPAPGPPRVRRRAPHRRGDARGAALRGPRRAGGAAAAAAARARARLPLAAPRREERCTQGGGEGARRQELHHGGALPQARGGGQGAARAQRRAARRAPDLALAQDAPRPPRHVRLVVALPAARLAARAVDGRRGRGLRQGARAARLRENLRAVQAAHPEDRHLPLRADGHRGRHVRRPRQRVHSGARAAWRQPHGGAGRLQGLRGDAGVHRHLPVAPPVRRRLRPSKATATPSARPASLTAQGARLLTPERSRGRPGAPAALGATDAPGGAVWPVSRSTLETRTSARDAHLPLCNHQ